MDSGQAFTPEELKSVPHLNLISYIKLAMRLGQAVEDKYLIPRVVPLIQSADESANGNSGLARKDCNVFGIKATDWWKNKGGKFSTWPTKEEINGVLTPQTADFRAYASWLESFMDWGRMISSASDYKKAYSLLKDPGTLREGISEMAKTYAWNSKYAQDLLGIYDIVKQDHELGGILCSMTRT